jgi:hypothetical protein
MPTIFYNFPKNILNIFRRYLAWHLLAIFLTFIFVTTGFDWFYFESSRNSLLQTLLWPAVRMGSRVPIIVPVVLLIIGKLYHKQKTVIVANALGQSVVIGFSYLFFLQDIDGKGPSATDAIAVCYRYESRFSVRFHARWNILGMAVFTHDYCLCYVSNAIDAVS